MTLGGREYLLQYALRDLHMLHGDNLTELLQGVNISDLIHELHTAGTVNNMLLESQIIVLQHSTYSAGMHQQHVLLSSFCFKQMFTASWMINVALT